MASIILRNVTDEIIYVADNVYPILPGDEF